MTILTPPTLVKKFDSLTDIDVTPTVVGTASNPTITLEANEGGANTWRGDSSVTIRCDDYASGVQVYMDWRPSGNVDMSGGDCIAIVMEIIDAPVVEHITTADPDNSPYEWRVIFATGDGTVLSGTTPRAQTSQMFNKRYMQRVQVATLPKSELTFSGSSNTDFTSLARVDVRLSAAEPNAGTPPNTPAYPLALKVHSIFTYDSSSYIDAIPVCLTFDDSNETQYSEVFSYCKPRKVPFTCYVISGSIGVGDRLTEDELAEMKDSGLVSLAVHGRSSLDAGAVGTDTWVQDMEQCWEDLNAAPGSLRAGGKVLANTVKTMACPFGRITQDCFDALDSRNYYLVRGTAADKDSFNAQDKVPVLFGEVMSRHFPKSYKLDGTTTGYDTAANHLAFVDEAIAQGSGIILHGHNIVASSPGSSNDFLRSEFQALIDGLLTREYAGQIKLVTDAAPDQDSLLSMLGVDVPSQRSPQSYIVAMNYGRLPGG